MGASPDNQALADTGRRSTRTPQGLALKSLAMHLAAQARLARTGLLVNTSADGPAYNVKVLGSLGDNHTLIASAPANADHSLIAVLKGQALTCRWLNASSAFRFRATILRLAFEPVPLMYLELPRRIEHHPLRGKPRVSVTLFGMFKANSRGSEALIVDLSVSGARIGVAEELQLPKEIEAQLMFRVAMLENDFLLDLKCVVRGALGRTEAQHPGIEFYGLDFVDVPQFDLLVLHACVQERLSAETDWLSQLLGQLAT